MVFAMFKSIMVWFTLQGAVVKNNGNQQCNKAFAFIVITD